MVVFTGLKSNVMSECWKWLVVNSPQCLLQHFSLQFSAASHFQNNWWSHWQLRAGAMQSCALGGGPRRPPGGPEGLAHVIHDLSMARQADIRELLAADGGKKQVCWGLIQMEVDSDRISDENNTYSLFTRSNIVLTNVIRWSHALSGFLPHTLCIWSVQ